MSRSLMPCAQTRIHVSTMFMVKFTFSSGVRSSRFNGVTKDTLLCFSLRRIPHSTELNMLSLENIEFTSGDGGSGMRFRRAGVLVVTRLLFRDGIELNGLPASPTEIHRRLFALPPCRSAVSPLPSSILNDLARIIVLSRMDVPFLLWSQDPRLVPLRALQFCAVGGVSSNACAFESRPPAHQPVR